MSNEKGEIFVNLEDSSQLLALDPKTLEVKLRCPLAPCEEPPGLAIDRKNRRLFFGCGNQVMAVVDADTGKVIGTLPIGQAVDAAAFDPETSLALASCGEGVVSVLHEDSADKFGVVENVPTPAWRPYHGTRPHTH